MRIYGGKRVMNLQNLQQENSISSMIKTKQTMMKEMKIVQPYNFVLNQICSCW